MNEAFDPGDRPGTYLKPMIRTVRGEEEGGALDADQRADAALDELDERLRALREPAVVTPPIFADDALRGTKNPLFAVHALREFVSICLEQAPLSRTKRR